MLNPIYTKEDGSYRLWKIKDFINKLKYIGFDNFANIEYDFYI